MYDVYTACMFYYHAIHPLQVHEQPTIHNRSQLDPELKALRLHLPAYHYSVLHWKFWILLCKEIEMDASICLNHDTINGSQSVGCPVISDIILDMETMYLVSIMCFKQNSPLYWCFLLLLFLLLGIKIGLNCNNHFFSTFVHGSSAQCSVHFNNCQYARKQI